MGCLSNIFQEYKYDFKPTKTVRYSLPTHGVAGYTSFEHYVTVIITARGRLDQLRMY